MNGIGQLLVHCIDAFPPSYSDYVNNKDAAKIRLQAPMRELKDRFQRKALLRAFLRKAVFNGGEVNYLTIFHNDKFHVYWNDDVVSAMADVFEVVNSKARSGGQMNDQKVLFRHHGKNVGELEMRNDSESHYGEVRFNMNKDPCMRLLEEAGFQPSQYSSAVLVYGQAINNFGKW